MVHQIIEYLDEMIADCEHRLQSAKDEVLKIEGQLIAYQLTRKEFEHLIKNPHESTRFEKTRDFSETWKSILRYINQRGIVSIDEIDKFNIEQNLQIQRGAIRAQMHSYNRRGIVSRVSSGRYELTKTGKAYIDLFE